MPDIVPAGPQDLGDVLVATSFIRRGAPEGVRPPGEPPGIVSRVGLTLVIIRVSCGTTARSDLLIRWLWQASDLAAGHMAASLELSVMVKDPVEATLARFSRWAGKTTRELSGDPVLDVGELRLLLDLMRNHLGIDDPADLGRGDIEELLLSVYPRKVTVLDREDTADTVPALRDLLAFLAETGAVPGQAVRRLEGELDEVAPRFADAVMDPARWGMASSFARAMAADGVDFGDSAAVDRWIARYNAGSDAGAVRDRLPAGAGDANDWGLDGEDDDDYGLKEGFGLPDRLPAMRLRPRMSSLPWRGTHRCSGG